MTISRSLPVTVMGVAIAALILVAPSAAQASSEPAVAPTFSAVTIVESKGTPVPLTGLEPLPPGGEAQLVLQVSNVGDGPAEGSVAPIVIKDVLPEGLEATNIEAAGATCELSTLRCSYAGTILPFELDTAVYVNISVKVKPGVSGELSNQVSVGGGGSQVVAVSQEAVRVSGEAVGNGLDGAPILATNANGSQDTVAGSHPFEVTSTVVPDTVETKDLRFELPDGLVGNTNVLPQCSVEAFDVNEKAHRNACPEATVVGVATVILGDTPYTTPLFNLVPSPGEPARFGFEVQSVPVILDASVRTGHGYGVTIDVHNVPQIEGFRESQLTFWGVPAQTVHNQLRGWGCLELVEYGGSEVPCGDPEDPQVPFLTMPTACAGPNGLGVTSNGDTWQDQTMSAAEAVLYTPLEGMEDCNELNFEPSLKVAPDGEQASTPTGLTVDVHQPQAGALNPTGTVGAAVRDITVALPEGVVVNPAGADGLQACSEEQIGYTGMQELEPAAEPGAKTATFTPEEQSCPTASKIGTVKITTPLLPNPLEGAVYLAAQDQNPFGSLLALYIVARDPVSGVLVKLPAEVSLNPVTGQVTTTVENSPQVPFEDAELHFFGGARAPLATPAHCGLYTTDASFEPWSGTPAVESGSSFDVREGPNGSACPGVLPFAPSLTAGNPNNDAGSFSPLDTTITREDGQQNIDRVTLKMPPGLTGILTGVPLCHEAEANAGTCPAASKIGSTIVSVGLGGDPYSVTGGEVFLTEKYEGAPFGLSIVNPAVAGPFNLGKVIVRAKIEIDPRTAALTVTTGEIPHILDGIPLQIKHVHVEIERPGFIVNPTSCEPMQITGSVGSVEGAGASVSEPFSVTNCAALKLEPKVEALVNGDVTKANGTSFTVKISKPAGLGEQANLQKFKVELPKQLPSRLTTLQKACTKAQFLANPADCPAASVVGHMRALTPVLPVPVEGPLYFVSNGGESFPNLVAVLQGYGVTIDLTGTTFISKAGITSSTFGTIPDVPFTFAEVNLHNGPYSALTGLGNLCAQSLAMPTEMIGQNGAPLHESTKIAVTGCAKAKPKAKTLTRAQKLKKALAACHKDRNKTKRARCEKAARKKYGPAKKGKKTKKK